MKPYDKSNSLMRRVTKRVSEFIPGVTWMNSLLGDSHSPDDSTSENNDQPPVKKLCTSNNTFITHTSYCTPIDIISPVNPTDDSKNYGNANLPEVSAVTCLPSTSRQNPKFTSQSNSSSQGHDIGNRSSLKRKSDVADLSHINRPSPKTIPFNFASSTPTLVTTNKQPVNSSLKRSLNSDKFSSNEFSSPVSTTFNKPRDNESQTTLKFREATKPISSASFRWDTFVNYGELSERQKLFAQKSPLNCSQVMYGGSSARSTLSKILGTTPPIHRKTVIPISPTNNSEIRTTSSILLGHISTKDKEIEENKFIIQPRVHQRHKADQKTVPLKVETTVKSIETTPEKKDDKSNDISSVCSGRNISRKIRADISKKARGLKADEFEILPKVDLPNISLTVPVLPTISFSTSNDNFKPIDDSEFTFNQPLTIEQFSLQIAEKTSRKKQKMTLKKSQNTSIDMSSKDLTNSTVRNSSSNISTSDTFKIESKKVPIINIDGSKTNDKVSDLSKFGDNSSDIPTKSVPNSNSNLESSKAAKMISSYLSLETAPNNKNEISEKLPVKPKKWTCDDCWISNDDDKTICIACQTPRSVKENTQKPISLTKSSTWTCETCWVPNKNEIDACVACQTQKPGTTKKVIDKNSDWTCDACWVKNKSGTISCISCGTTKPGSAPENKPQPSNQFKFGLNNNSSETSGSSQFKFGFDSSKTNQSSDQFKFGFDNSKTDQSSGQFKFGYDSKTDQSSGQFKFGFDSKTDQSAGGQFKFGSTSFKTSENGKSDSAIADFKFGMDNNKIDQPIVNTFKFGTDGTANQSVKTLNKVTKNNTDKPESKIKFDEKKLDESENPYTFGQSPPTTKPIAEFKFGSQNIESDKTDGNKIVQSTNELKCLINNKNEVSEKLTELQSKKNQFKFGDTKPLEKSTPKIVFGSIETNSNNLNSLTNIGQTNEDKGKNLWDKKDKNETKPLNFGMSQSTVGSSSTNQMVNGHSHSNETPNEDQKSGLIKTSQLFNFGSIVRQDLNVPDDQKNPSTFSFGSANDKSFVGASPMLAVSNFPSTSPVFGASNSLFNSGTTTSTSAALGSSALSSQFSFGSMAPNTNSFFSKPVKENDKNPLSQNSNSFTSTTQVGFPFGIQSPPVFSVPNTGGFIKSSVSVDEPTKSTPNLFNQSSTKQTVKLDPNAPISINFTGGATTQFTAKPETSEPPAKRKILKPVRRIR